MKNDCSIVRDLLPLYAEDMVSKDTAEFVDEHLEGCTGCSEELKVLKEGRVTETESELAQAEKAKAKSFKKIMKKLNIRYDILGSLLVVFAALFSMALSRSNDMFYNLFLMPALGVCGYCLFSHKAFYKIPLLIAVTNLFAFGVKLVEYESFWFTYFYITLSVVGVVIAMLFHLVFKKSDIKNRAGKVILKVSALCTALVITGVVCFVGFVFVGNPVSLILAKNGAEDYISQTYPDTDFEITEVGHEFKHGGYYANVSSPSSKDIWFNLTLDGLGNVISDNYDFTIESGSNTYLRLDKEYTENVANVISSKAFPCKVDFSLCTLNINWENLEVDEIYNVSQLAYESGEITLRVYDDDLSKERMAELLLEIKEAFDKAGVGFKRISLEIIRESDADNFDRPSIEEGNILYSDICEEKLAQRLK